MVIEIMSKTAEAFFLRTDKIISMKCCFERGAIIKTTDGVFTISQNSLQEGFFAPVIINDLSQIILENYDIEAYKSHLKEIFLEHKFTVSFELNNE